MPNETRELLNIVNNPMKDYKHNEGTREKMSEIKKQFYSNPENRKMISDAMKGKHNSPSTEFKKGNQSWKLRKISEETKRKMSLAKLGKKQSEEHKKKISKAMKGHRVSKETRKKIGLIHLGNKYRLGYKHSEQTKQKIRLGNIGKKRSLETIEKLRINGLKMVVPFQDTQPELKLQNSLMKINIPFEKHKTIENFIKSDLFIKPNIVIFVDGCFFHACEKCHDINKLPDWVIMKKAKDIIITIKLKNIGYKVLRFWEHDINNNFEQVLDEIIFTIKEIGSKPK